MSQKLNVCLYERASIVDGRFARLGLEFILCIHERKAHKKEDKQPDCCMQEMKQEVEAPAFLLAADLASKELGGAFGTVLT